MDGQEKGNADDSAGEVEICQNCDAELKGAYCHECGQSTVEWHRPMRHLTHDLLNSLIQWDSRLFHTFRLLFTNPGQLSLDFTRGKRVRYVPPLRLYIAASFVLFLLVGIFSLEIQQSAVDIKVVDAELTGIQREMDEALAEGNQFLFLILQGVKNALEDPVAYSKKIFSNLPKAAFLLLPIFAFLHRIVMFRHKRFGIEYLVFSLHFHSLVFFILSLGIILSQLHPRINDWTFLLVFLIPIYLVIGFHSFNEESWLKSFIKSFLVSGTYLVTLIFALALYFTVNLVI